MLLCLHTIHSTPPSLFTGLCSNHSQVPTFTSWVCVRATFGGQSITSKDYHKSKKDHHKYRIDSERRSIQLRHNSNTRSAGGLHCRLPHQVHTRVHTSSSSKKVTVCTCFGSSDTRHKKQLTTPILLGLTLGAGATVHTETQNGTREWRTGQQHRSPSRRHRPPSTRSPPVTLSLCCFLFSYSFKTLTLILLQLSLSLPSSCVHSPAFLVPDKPNSTMTKNLKNVLYLAVIRVDGQCIVASYGKPEHADTVSQVVNAPGKRSCGLFHF